MKIALDISPLSAGHKVRGVGFYIEYLKSALQKYYPENEYIFFGNRQEFNQTVDVVHYPYFDPFSLTLPVIKKNKYVITVHDLTPIIYPNHFPAGIRGNLTWNIQKFLLKKSDAILTDSLTSQKDIAGILKIRKQSIQVAYLAASEEFRKIENGKWKHEINRKYNLPERFVLYVGDITWNKNVPALIEAIKKINLTLVMVGSALVKTDFDRSNPWNSDLVALQKLTKRDKRFIKLGFIPTSDLVSLYNAAEVFVFPSIYEGFGLPILEAMQSGCPAVLSEEGAVKEVGGDAAFYVNPYNINDIANGIGEVFYNTKLQRELSAKGLARAEKFSWKKTAEDTMKIYKKVLNY